MKVLFYSDEFAKMRDVILAVIKGHEVDTAEEGAAEEKIAAAEVLVTRPGVPAGAELLRRAPKLKLLQQWGAGLEGIDFAACRELGIPVCNVPSKGTGNAEGVAEIALLHMLLLGRKYAFAQENVRTGKMFSPRGISLWKKTACIIGLGNLGSTLAGRLSAMGMTLCGVNRTPLSTQSLTDMGVTAFFPLARLREAVRGCRFVIAALAFSEETRGIFDGDFFHAMDQGAFFINIARGGLVREDALLHALNEGHLAGAGLDVLADEPPRPDNPLLSHPLVSLTPHIGGNTDASLEGIFGFIQSNIDRLSRGEAPLSRQDLKRREE